MKRGAASGRKGAIANDGRHTCHGLDTRLLARGWYVRQGLKRHLSTVADRPAHDPAPRDTVHLGRRRRERFRRTSG